MDCSHIGDPTPIVDHSTQTVFVMASRSYPHHGMTNIQSRWHGMMDLWLLKSVDSGASFSSPVNITDQVWSNSKHLPTPASGHGTQITTTGRLLMPATMRPNVSVESAVMYSDNHGERWNYANTSLVGPGSCEGEIAELQNTPGTLILNVRHTRNMRSVTFSTDAGMHWRPLEPVPALPDPGCKGALHDRMILPY